MSPEASVKTVRRRESLRPMPKRSKNGSKGTLEAIEESSEEEECLVETSASAATSTGSGSLTEADLCGNKDDLPPLLSSRINEKPPDWSKLDWSRTPEYGAGTDNDGDQEGHGPQTSKSDRMPSTRTKDRYCTGLKDEEAETARGGMSFEPGEWRYYSLTELNHRLNSLKAGASKPQHSVPDSTEPSQSPESPVSGTLERQFSFSGLDSEFFTPCRSRSVGTVTQVPSVYIPSGAPAKVCSDNPPTTHVMPSAPAGSLGPETSDADEPSSQARPVLRLEIPQVVSGNPEIVWERMSAQRHSPHEDNKSVPTEDGSPVSPLEDAWQEADASLRGSSGSSRDTIRTELSSAGTTNTSSLSEHEADASTCDSTNRRAVEWPKLRSNAGVGHERNGPNHKISGDPPSRLCLCHTKWTKSKIPKRVAPGSLHPSRHQGRFGGTRYPGQLPNS